MNQQAAGGGTFAKPTVRSPWMAQFFLLFMLGGMLKELNAVSGSSLSLFGLFVPMYNMWWLFSIIPGEAAKAKQKAGCKTPARGGIVYIMLPGYALASDLNDIAQGT